jgi:ubiquinone/menaquinone biosynthesis C-methylase UbiE/DNA-binding transcriptional ArsR family regulator
MSKLLPALKAAADETRLRILRLLGHLDLAVSDLTRILRQSQPRVSRHLKLLSDAGLIERHKEGAWVFYTLAQRGEQAPLVHALLGLIDSDTPEAMHDQERLHEVRQARVAAAERYFARHAASWDLISSMHTSQALVEQAICEILAERPIGALLDIGTGTGRILELLGPQATHALGIDNNRDMLAVARGKLAAQPTHNGWQVRQADLFDLPSDLGTFDTIVIHQVLHYLDNPRGAVSSAGALLKPQGQLLVVDFAPHEKEALREQHAHLRLGFSEAQIFDYFAKAQITPKKVQHLEGSEITITLWLGEKSA